MCNVVPVSMSVYVSVCRLMPVMQSSLSTSFLSISQFSLSAASFAQLYFAQLPELI